jgi:hypothetical protein
MMPSSKSSIPGNDLLQAFENQGGAATKLGIFLRRYVLPTVSNTAKAAGVSPAGQLPPPQPPTSLTVTPLGNEHVKLDINHVAPIIRGARYFTEIKSNDPSFQGSMIHDHGASRSSLPVFLPTNDGNGAPHTYYAVSYVQYPGGPPSKPTPVVKFTMGGATNADIPPGTGSGTALNGGQTLQGLGHAPIRH